MEPECWVKWYVDNDGEVWAGSVEPSWVLDDDDEIVWLVQQ